jgi:hypothetical protein
MTTAVRLTTVDQFNPPITVNPSHVVTLRPRFKVVPNMGSQAGGLLPRYEGAELHLVTGFRVNIAESYDEAHRILFGNNHTTGVDVPKLLPEAKIAEIVSGTITKAQAPPLEQDNAPGAVAKETAKKPAPAAAEKKAEEKDED